MVWAGFSQNPPDARSATLAAVDLPHPNEASAADFRFLGAPTVFACNATHLYWFQHDVAGTRFLERVASAHVANFFHEHKQEFNPQRIYRAKTSAKFNPSQQLYFVDAGLMPLLEQSSGEWLGRQVELLVNTVHGAMPKANTSKDSAKWVFQSVFWLLAARLLRDKNVPSFKTVNVADPDEVFDRVGRHYTASAPSLNSAAERNAMIVAGQLVNKFPSLINVTTESMAYVYENTLVSKEVRDAFGTHSTPSWLVDYILFKLTPWIEDMSPDDRHVCEPACGHAPFLVGAMRLLRQLSPENLNDAERSQYLRKRIHGVEVDDFAREIGRLSLTLADVPNRNGWDLARTDMFAGNTLSNQLKRSSVVLANPPFENFTEKEKKLYKNAPGLGVTYNNKAAQLLARIVTDLPANGVFGLVMPQSILTSANSRAIRRRLTQEFELEEICLLPDRVFNISKAESVVLLGRRRQPSQTHMTRCQRVRPWDIQAFKTRLEPSSESTVPQGGFLLSRDVSWRLPDLLEVWEALRDRTRLGEVARIQKGFEFKNEQELAGRQVVSDRPKSGFRKAYLSADDDFPIWGTPVPQYIDYSGKNLRRLGADFSKLQVQIVVNYAGPQKPWRLRATLDPDGTIVSSRFLLMRLSISNALSPTVLWAILNSPVANAYSYSVSTKWQTLPKEWDKFPIPQLDAESSKRITDAANAYRKATNLSTDGNSAESSESQVHDLLMRMDAAVLQAYALPPGLEQQMLRIFDDIERPGVGCKFTSYPQVPTTVTLPFHLRLLLPRFHDLVDLRLANRINRKQQAELTEIEESFNAYESKSPRHDAFRAWMNELDREHAKSMAKLQEIEATLLKRAGGGGA